MAGSEPSPKRDEPPTSSNLPSRSITNKEGEGRTKVPHGQGSEVNDEEKEIDDFGLPVKRIPRRPSSIVDYDTASEDGDPKITGKPGEGEVKGISPVDSQLPRQKLEKTHEASPEGSSPLVNGDDTKQTPQPRPDSCPRETKTAEATNPRVIDHVLPGNTGTVSGWSHQALVPQKIDNEGKKEGDEWQSMPSYAAYDLYDDDGHLIAREAPGSDEEANAYHGLGGAGKGYTRVQIDEDAKSATSMDDNTGYLFQPKDADVQADEEEQRDPLQQLQATKDLLTEGQRIAYVGLTRLAMAEMVKELEEIPTTRSTKKVLGFALESMKMWSQKMMVRLYMHMDIDSSGKFCLSMCGNGSDRKLMLLMRRASHDRTAIRARRDTE